MRPELIDATLSVAGRASEYHAAFLAFARDAGGDATGAPLEVVHVAPGWAEVPGARRRFLNRAFGEEGVQLPPAVLGVVGALRVDLGWAFDPRDAPVAPGLTAWELATLALLRLDRGPHALAHHVAGRAPVGHACGAGARYDLPPLDAWHPTDAREWLRARAARR